jgi:hypothetical protein
VRTPVKPGKGTTATIASQPSRHACALAAPQRSNAAHTTSTSKRVLDQHHTHMTPSIQQRPHPHPNICTAAAQRVKYNPGPDSHSHTRCGERGTRNTHAGPPASPRATVHHRPPPPPFACCLRQRWAFAHTCARRCRDCDNRTPAAGSKTPTRMRTRARVVPLPHTRTRARTLTHTQTAMRPQLTA